MEYLIAIVCLGVIWLAYVVIGLFKRIDHDQEQELDDWIGVTDVRREAEEAKHNNPDSIKRMRDKYNS